MIIHMSVYLINPLILYLVVVCLNQLHDTLISNTLMSSKGVSREYKSE